MKISAETIGLKIDSLNGRRVNSIQRNRYNKKLVVEFIRLARERERTDENYPE